MVMKHPSPIKTSGLIKKIVDQEAISTLLQPIVHIEDRRIWGYEALSRGPSSMLLRQPAVLFDRAVEVGLQQELESLCLRLALQRFKAAGIDGLLFVNISYETLSLGEVLDSKISSAMAENNLQSKDIVIELTEHTPSQDLGKLREAVKYFRAKGFAIALDDLGAGYSSLQLWSEIKPDYVKIDRHFISKIDRNLVKQNFVRSMVDIALSQQCNVIAEGVETRGEAEILAAMKIKLMQGYFFARPQKSPEGLNFAGLPISIQKTADKDRAITLTSHALSVGPDALVGAVADLFHKNELVTSVAVVDNEMPVGIINRRDLLETLSRLYGYDLYSRKPITTLMKEDPLIVSSNLRLEQVSRLVTGRARLEMSDDFIVVNSGVFVGVAQVIDLLKLITEVQVDQARHANPLTLLPGNVPISDFVEQLLQQDQPFTICYLDIDNFKPFNDAYGYSQGDEMLLLLAKILQKYCKGGEFIGHVGGDDFVLIFTRDDWQKSVDSIITEFVDCSGKFYDTDHMNSGGFTVTDRFGADRFFPLASLSIAALTVYKQEFSSSSDVSAELSKLKQQSKSIPGNTLVRACKDNTTVSSYEIEKSPKGLVRAVT